MRSFAPSLFSMLALLVVAVPASAQEDAAQARYEAAADWVHLVMIDGDYGAAGEQVLPAVAPQLGPSQLEAAVSQLTGQLGALQSLEPKEQTMEQGFHKIVFDGTFDRGTFDVQVFMSDEHAVAGFFVRPPGR